MDLHQAATTKSPMVSVSCHPAHRGVRRVRRARRSQRFQAQIRIDGRLRHLGTFPTIQAAAEAYDAATLRFREDPSPTVLNSNRVCTCDLAALR